MLAFFRKLFGNSKNFDNSKDSDSIQNNLMKKFLIVGLGNIGPKYHNTRHNIGFKMLDFVA